MQKIWTWFEEARHNVLVNFSFKYRQALRLIELQDKKIEYYDGLIKDSYNAINSLKQELEVFKEVSPFKGPKQFLEDAIKEGKINE